jgi:hypothetical protein
MAFEPVDLHTRPSEPSATACSNAASRTGAVATSSAVVNRSRSDKVSASRGAPDGPGKAAR